MNPAKFIRGAAFPGTKRDPYPRAKPGDGRLPGDTWYMATIPVGVRLEFTGDARAVEIKYEAKLADAAWQRAEFELWRDGTLHSTARASAPGEARATLEFGGGHAIVYLPERMFPRIVSIDGRAGLIVPAPRAPRWICYGDSIAEGWNASMPSRAWPSIVARLHGLDLVNMGYAGAARGELASAEQIAELDADVITIAYGTNCWSRIPFTAGLMRETFNAFIDLVRKGHPTTPILALSMLVRPEAETTPNASGTTHGQLRAVMEEVARERALNDPKLRLVEGRALIDASMLDDQVHPNDEGHARIAAVLGPLLAEMCSG